MKKYRNVVCLWLLSLAGCATPHFVFMPPSTGSYAKPPTPTELPATPEPELTALLPPATDQTLLADAPAPRPAAEAAPIRVPLLPDTVRRPPLTIADFPPDPTTTVVNVTGGVLAVTGVVLVGKALITEAPNTEYGGLGLLIGGIVGCVLLLSGLALAFFQGKNGRMRRLREARKVGVTPEDLPTAVNAAPLTKAERRKQVGIGVLLTGAILTIVGLLLGPFLLFGLLAMLIGLGFVVSGL